MVDKRIGKLEVLEEGNYWKAYFFPDVEDKEFYLLGSIHVYVIANNDKLKKEFTDLMAAAVRLIVENVEGTSIDLHLQT